jgi:hypothetical protein
VPGRRTCADPVGEVGDGVVDTPRGSAPEAGARPAQHQQLGAGHAGDADTRGERLTQVVGAVDHQDRAADRAQLLADRGRLIAVGLRMGDSITSPVVPHAQSTVSS